MAKMTAAERRQARRATVDLEFAIRRTRRTICNEAPTVIDRTTRPPTIDLLRVAMSKHAMQRCAEMNISPDLVRAMVASPATTYAQREGRWMAQHARENVAAIYTESADGRLVVTVLFREPFSRNADGQIPTRRQPSD